MNDSINLTAVHTEHIKDFIVNLSMDHLSEASFLYEQRLSLLDDPEITWREIDDFEQRFEAHIDGLVVGEDLALEVCRQQVLEGDFGELHAAIRVFCRQNRLDLIKDTVKAIDPEDNEKSQAVTDALVDEFPENRSAELILWMKDDDECLNSIIIKVMGFRRLNYYNDLLELLQQNEQKNIPGILWALGRLRKDEVRVPLYNNYLQNNDETISASAALALLRLGEPKALSYCQYMVQQSNWPFLLLGLSGSRAMAPRLFEIVMSDRTNPDSILALGLLGDISAIDILLNYLSNNEYAESAAIGLDLMTGAGLYEDIFMPEKIDEDELFEEEIEKMKAGEPIFSEGKEPGTTINRISQKPEEWIEWWNRNKSQFNPKTRYRNGKPYSPSCLLENLESEKSPRQIRQLAYEEFVIRYNVDFPFDTTMPVVKQEKAIDLYKKWVRENESRFNKGQWYFAGKLQ